MKTPNPLMILAALALVMAVAVSTPGALATSFIAECGDQDWREGQADVVIHGTVESVDEKGFGGSSRTEITFIVDDVIKGEPGETFVLTQPGRLDGGYQIPAMTLEWNVGEQWRIDTKQAAEDAYDYDGAISEGDNQLVCGVMSRVAIQEDGAMCAQVITRAQNQETGEFRDFPTPCDVPSGWDTILPVEPDGGIGDGAGPLDEMCAQVITYAINPETNALMEFPTPCDVPEGWEVTDEPIPVEPDGGIGDTQEPGVWERFTNWLKSLF